MEATLTLNRQILQSICQLGQHTSILEAVQKALEFYLKYLQQQAILTEFGQIDYDPDYNYKTQRARS